MQNLENILIHKNSEFLIGDYLTWLDLAIIGSWDWIQLHDPSEAKILAEFKTFNRHNRRVRSIPNMAKWLEIRPKTER